MSGKVKYEVKAPVVLRSQSNITFDSTLQIVSQNSSIQAPYLISKLD